MRKGRIVEYRPYTCYKPIMYPCGGDVKLLASSLYIYILSEKKSVAFREHFPHYASLKAVCFYRGLK